MQRHHRKLSLATSEPQYGNVLAPLEILHNDTASRASRLVSLFRRHDSRRNALRRIEDEEVSWIVEALNEPFETSYTLAFDGENILTNDNTPFRILLENGLVNASEISAAHPYYASFVMERSRVEHDNHLKQLRMARGELPNTMIEFSAMPTYQNDEEEALLRALGCYKVDRSMGLVRVSTWDATEQKMTIYSHSVDNADAELFSVVANLLGQDIPPGYTPKQLLSYPNFCNLTPANQKVCAERVVSLCDQSLASRHGGEWHAGRKQLPRTDVFNFVRSQSDVIAELLRGIQAINRDRTLSESEQRAELTAVRLGAVALMDARFNGKAHAGTINEQMHSAASWAGSENKVYDGCGLVVSSLAEKETLLSYSLLSMNIDPTKCVTCPYCEVVVDLPKEEYRNGILHCVACDTALDIKTKQKIRDYSKSKTVTKPKQPVKNERSKKKKNERTNEKTEPKKASSFWMSK